MAPETKPVPTKPEGEPTAEVAPGMPPSPGTEEPSPSVTPERRPWAARLERLRGLETGHRVRLALLLVGVPLVASLLVVGALRRDDAAVVRGLAPEAFLELATALRQAGIPYHVEGDEVRVPTDRVHEARLVAARVLGTSQQIVGFELFDRESGVDRTRFGQQVALRRALEGELVRTLKALRGIRWVRVHLPLQEPSLLRDEAFGARAASVVLGLEPGRELAPEEVRSIQSLVAGAVEGLKPAQVTVVDAQGRLLASGFEEERRERAARQERELVNELEAKLRRVVGELLPPGALVRTAVRVELDTEEVEEAEETYDPQVVPRSEEIQRGTGGVAGVAGSVANDPAGAGGVAEGGSYMRQVRNYEVSRRTVQRRRLEARIARISAAVVVRFPATATPPVDLEARVRAVAAAALGLDPERGDRLAVALEPTAVPVRQPVAEQPWWLTSTLEYLRYAPILLAVVLAYFWLVRPLQRLASAAPPAVTSLTVGEAKAALRGDPPSASVADPEPITPETERSEVLEPPAELEGVGPGEVDPDRLALILSRWARGG